MSATILTPLMLWKSFSLGNPPKTFVVSSKQRADAVVEQFYIDGKHTRADTVKIFCTSATPTSNPDAPAIIVFTDGRNDTEEKIALSLAKDGYRAFVVNLYGKKEGVEKYTLYPEDLDYANYEVAKENLYSVKKDVTKTCWYEWCLAGRYAFKAIKEKIGDAKVGVVGVKEFATVMWQLVAFEKDVSCAVSLFGYGWEAYKKIHKYGDKLEPQFDDETLMFVAGIEPESYALHVKCPTLILTATNSKDWSVDRAYDTLGKIKDDVFKAVDYSVGYSDSLSATETDNLKTFFKAHLTGEIDLGQAKAEIKAEVKLGKIEVEVIPEDEKVKEVVLYSAEEIMNPAKRCWIKSLPQRDDNGSYFFDYLPYSQSNTAFFFAKITLDSGFTFSTGIICKKFVPNEIGVSHKSTVIFSGRTAFGESVFAPVSTQSLIASAQEEVYVKNGPMGISGVYCQGGLVTYKINAVKDRPKDDAILMLDVFSKEENTVTVKLVDVNGLEYSVSLSINGGKVWFNLKIEKSKFKTKEGIILRSYDKIVRMELSSLSACLINNALWV